MNIEPNMVTSGDHIPYVERMIRTIKERTWAMRCSLRMEIKDVLLNWLVSHVAMWINVLFSKRAPMSAWRARGSPQLNYRDLTRTSFGDVVCAADPMNIKDSSKPRGQIGLSLGANPRIPGAIYFYNLHGKKKVVKTRIRFTQGIDLDLSAFIPNNPLYTLLLEFIQELYGVYQ